MGTKLYVGGLPYSTTEDTLRAAFEKAGAVEEAKIITDRMSGRSKGFGFITMASEDEAQAAIDMWHDQEFEGRKLTVNEARPLEDRPPRRDFGGGGKRW
ncbi:RNA-binding protein [Candidatus Gracilibacteria bacterium]|nr:RNA-binding protein [Candidatus Gracilibacteria bacterium]